eukprot:TRINITY_DN1934_c0_g1_i1.p2 TRINITY_DN1934_c0_g1~~TRINITY_DN1934_c0_g1_i1.p2  ORF type:complete len:85 (-),score=12.48 TRINITY_DN1934_c0_g1_i1:206-460(-)
MKSDGCRNLRMRFNFEKLWRKTLASAHVLSKFLDCSVQTDLRGTELELDDKIKDDLRDQCKIMRIKYDAERKKTVRNSKSQTKT